MPNANRDVCWHSLRRLIAGVLVAAAVLKALNSTQILVTDGLLSSKPLLLATIGFEAGAALYLVTGPLFGTWLLTLGTFTVFAFISGYALGTGQDCNCFAEAIDSRVTLTLDMIVLSLAIWFRPVRHAVWGSGMSRMIPRAAAVGLCASMAAAGWHEMSIRSESLEALNPDELIGRPWPLGDLYHSELGELLNGNWLLVVAARDCERCHELIERHFPQPTRHRADERTAVFVADGERWPFQFDEVSLDVSGEAVVSWPGDAPFVSTPAVFVIQDGNVVEAADGKGALRVIAALFQSVP